MDIFPHRPRKKIRIFLSFFGRNLRYRPQNSPRLDRSLKKTGDHVGLFRNLKAKQAMLFFAHGFFQPLPQLESSYIFPFLILASVYSFTQCQSQVGFITLDPQKSARLVTF
jgi:hypothetical protein